MNIVIKILYDGTNYCGWQKQPDRISIQEVLEKAVLDLTGEVVDVIASGRTDAGVHALGQVASFKLKKDFDISKVLKGLNFYLREDIRVCDARLVSDDFSARFSAIKKTYQYQIYVSNIDNPLLKNRAVRVQDVDIKALRAKAREFVGEFDFKRYNSSGGGAKTTVRKMFDISIDESEYIGERIIKIELTANGFLYNMVRKIVGVLLKKDAEFIKQSIKEPYMMVSEIAPPYGLYLKEVFYEKNN